MFGKAILFVLAFATFVSAAHVVDYSAYPGARPLRPIGVALPDGRHKLQPVASKRYVSGKFQFAPQDSNKLQPPNLQATARTKRGLDLDLSKRQNLRDGWLNHFRIHGGMNVRQEKRSLRDIWFRKFRDATGINVSKRDVVAFDPFGLQILADLGANGRVEARDTVADAQLQTFVSNTAILLRAIGKSDAADTFLSKVNSLKAEAQNGSLEPDDLLDAARAFAASILS